MSDIWWAMSQKEANTWADVRSVSQPIDGAVSQDSVKTHCEIKRKYVYILHIEIFDWSYGLISWIE